MKRISLLLFILLLPVFAVAGFYGYLWWRVSDLADQMVAQASPFMEISYEGVRIDLLETEVALQDLRVAPMGVGDQLRVEEVVLKSRDWSQLMRLDGNLRHEPWPEALTLRLEGMLFHLDGPMVQQWTDMAMQVQPEPAYVFGRFCSSLQGPELMQAMGYRMVSLDMAMGYQFDPYEQRMTINTKADADQLSDFSFQMQLETSDVKLTSASISGNSALQMLSMHVRDRGFNRRYRKYCATQAGVKDEAFDAALEQEFVQLGQLVGVQLPDTVVQHAVDMYKPGASMGLALQPKRPVGQFDLMSLDSAEAFIELFNPSININNQHVTGEELNALLNEAIAAASNATPVEQVVTEIQPERATELAPEVVANPEVAVQQESMIKPRPSASGTPAVKGFRVTPLSDVRQYIGKRIRMVTYFGRRVEGRILEVDSQEMLIEQRMDRGVATYSIALEKVAELEVYR